MLSLERPRLVFEYSKVNGLVTFNDTALGNPISIPSNLKPGAHYSKPKSNSWNVTYGLKKFQRYVFPKTESRIELLLLSVIEYESLNKKESDLVWEFANLGIDGQKGTKPILCHNGIFTDITLNTGDEYEVIYYKDQLIFASTNRRENQNKLWSYIGLKFENYLKRDKSIPYNDHYKALLQGNYKGWSFYSVVEIDGIISRLDKPTSNDDKTNKFAEVKLMNIRRAITEEELCALETSEDILLFLKKNIPMFKCKLPKILCQCYFGRQDNIVIGIRNERFEVMTIFQLSTQTLIEFTKKFYPNIYSRFNNSATTIDLFFNQIHKFIMSNRSLADEKENVFLVKTKKNPVITKLDSISAKKAFDVTIIPEFVTWRTENRNVIIKSKYIKREDYRNKQEPRLP